jgi:hypothetical protein
MVSGVVRRRITVTWQGDDAHRSADRSSSEFVTHRGAASGMLCECHLVGPPCIEAIRVAISASWSAWGSLGCGRCS